MSLTKKPMKPMMAKPMAVATAIFWNSAIRITTGYPNVLNIGEKTYKMASVMEKYSIT